MERSFTEKAIRTLRAPLAGLALFSAGFVAGNADQIRRVAAEEICGVNLLEPKEDNPYPAKAKDVGGLRWAVDGHYINGEQVVLVYEGFCGPLGSFDHVAVPQVIEPSVEQSATPVAQPTIAPVSPEALVPACTAQNVENRYGKGRNGAGAWSEDDTVPGTTDHCANGWQLEAKKDTLYFISMKDNPGTAQVTLKGGRNAILTGDAERDDVIGATLWIEEQNAELLRKKWAKYDNIPVDSISILSQ